MRAALLSTVLFALAAACGDGAPGRGDDGAAAPSAAPAVDVAASDELPDLAAAPTGVAFWTHPNVAFNGLLIVASADGLRGYNIENGDPVSAVEDFPARGLAVSYAGFGPEAAGLVATYDESAGAFRLFGVDNASRRFIPLRAEIALRGAPAGFCMGRAGDAPEPTLYALFGDEAAAFALAPVAGADVPSLAVDPRGRLALPADASACAVDEDGTLLVADAGGAVFRLDGDDASDAPFARGDLGDVAGMAVMPFGAVNGLLSVDGEIILLDGADGRLRVFDRADGSALGVASVAATEAIPETAGATALGASAANLGGLYRDGVLALGIDAGDAPSVRLIPGNGLFNALDRTTRTTHDPRGVTRIEKPDEALAIDPTGFDPAGPASPQDGPSTDGED